MDPSNYSADAILRDGTPLNLRAIRPDDKQHLLDGFHRLSGKSVYFRFLSSKPDLSAADLKYFTELDFKHHVAIGASIRNGDAERPIGIVRYVESNDHSSGRVAEVAMAVEDAFQGHGVGTVLFEHIVNIARAEGFTRVQADVLAGNGKMLNIFRHSGFSIEEHTVTGVVHIEFDITDSPKGAPCAP